MADDSDQVGQDEIEQLLRQAQGGSSDAGAAPDPPAKAEEPPEPVEDATVDQSEIEALLAGGSPAATAAPPPAAPATSAPAAEAPVAASAGGSPVAQDDLEFLFNKAEKALASIDESAETLPAGVRNFEFQKFGGTAANTESATLELMRDVQLDMTIELGRTHMRLEDVLKLKQGAVVPLDKLAGDPADIFVNGRLVARGEVLVLNDSFCVRIAELIVGESAVA